jgi:hypothetical protein
MSIFVLSLGIIGFFLSMYYLNLFDSKIEYENNVYLLKMAFATSFIPLSLSFGTYFIVGKKVALVSGGSMALFLITGFLLGFINH